MNNIQVLALGAILLAILGYFCIYNHALFIQNDIQDRVEQALNLEETQHINISTQGRDITLSGHVASDSIKQLAETYTRKIDGVREINNNIKVTQDEPSPTITSSPNSKEKLDEAPIEKEILNPTVAPLPEFSCQEDFDFLLRNNKINFTSNSDTIDSSSYDLLRDLLDVANRCSDVNIEISGHTDSQGSEEYNLQLSQKRAESVLDYLTNNGIEVDRLTAIGYGETNPIADNETPEGLEANRRIEFKVEGP